MARFNVSFIMPIGVYTPRFPQADGSTKGSVEATDFQDAVAIAKEQFIADRPVALGSSEPKAVAVTSTALPLEGRTYSYDNLQLLKTGTQDTV